MLTQNSLIMKTLYTEVEVLDNILSRSYNIQEACMSEQALKLQIKGNTIFHILALNEGLRKAVLEH